MIQPPAASMPRCQRRLAGKDSTAMLRTFARKLSLYTRGKRARNPGQLACDGTTLPRTAEQEHRLSITADHLDKIAFDFQTGNHAPWRGSVLGLPEWFDVNHAPTSLAFRNQMLRFWCEITGRTNYNPTEHEDTPEIADADSLIRPAFYGSSDLHYAGAQIIAMGHIVMRSGVVAGDRVLEYGAGFGQTALAFARLGAQVDTVDINPAFCKAVKRSAEHFLATLTPHLGEFGLNPAGHDHAYKLILFYESFHHCFDFFGLIETLPSLLAPGGRILLAGEPIFDQICPELPYPWGFRLDWENVAVMRHRGWMELGFQRTFLLDLFEQAGFTCRVYTDPNSHWATIYDFQRAS